MERSQAGRVVISVAVVVVLLAEVATHLPNESAVSQEVGSGANRLIRVIGTEQQWGVFAPDPRQTSLRVEGRVTFEDGSTAVWHLPEGPRLGANLRYYRWRKWLERVRDDNQSGLWEPTARWIASEFAGGPSPVAMVELVRLFHRNTVNGKQPDYDEFTYYTYVPEADETSG
jgi:hypothetical protein